MHIYFGATDDTEDTYSEDGKNYYYMLESLDEDGIILRDSCNRVLPFAVDEVPALITALKVYMQKEGGINLFIDALQNSKEDCNFTID